MNKQCLKWGAATFAKKTTAKKSISTVSLRWTCGFLKDLSITVCRNQDDEQSTKAEPGLL